MFRRSWLRVARAFLVGAIAFALLGAAPATTKPAADQSFSQDELNALFAPIALYPDGGGPPGGPPPGPPGPR